MGVTLLNGWTFLNSKLCYAGQFLPISGLNCLPTSHPPTQKCSFDVLQRHSYRVFLGNCQNQYAYERALRYKIWAGTGVFISFWDRVSKKFHNHSVIIHLWRLQRCIIAEISKIHWKSTIKNISIVLQISPQRNLGSS